VIEDLNIIEKLTRGAEDVTIHATSYQPNYPLMVDRNHGPFKPVKTLVESIQRNFEFLLLTNPGEWPMDPNKGVGVLKVLFEPARPEKIAELSRGIELSIRQQLNKYLKAVDLISAELFLDVQKQVENQVSLKLVYVINKSVVVQNVIKNYAGSIITNLTILDEYKSTALNIAENIKLTNLISDSEEI
jgi:hypothetical protein